MRHKKLLTLFISFILIVSQICIIAVEAKTVNTIHKTAQIGGKPADLIYIKTGEGITGEITLASNSVSKDQDALTHIKNKNAEGGKKVLAAINGGYFNSYYNASKRLVFPDNCAQTFATIIQKGVVVNAGGNKPILGFTSTGKALIDRVKIETTVTIRSSIKVVTWAVNNYYKTSTAIMLFTPQLGYSVAIPESSTVVYIKNNTVAEIKKGGVLNIPSNTYALVYNKSAYDGAAKYGNQPQLGNSAVVTNVISPSVKTNAGYWEDVQNAVGAGPLLLLNGKDVTNTNSDFTDPKQSINLVSARSFAAILSDGRLVIGSAKASMKQIATYLLSIGAKDAMALDGGSSTMLYTAEKGFIYKAGRKLSNVLNIVEYTSRKLPANRVKTDLDNPSSWAKESIELAEIKNLIPTNIKSAYKTNLTRQEFCNLAMQLIRIKSSVPYKTLILNTGIKYNDVKFSDAYHIDVIDCYRLGIVTSTGTNSDGKMCFSPNNCITYEEAQKMIQRIADILNIKLTNQILASNGSSQTNQTDYYTREQAIVDMLRLYNS